MGAEFLKFNKTTCIAVGGGPDGYDFYNGTEIVVGANNTYSTVRKIIFQLIKDWLKSFNDLQDFFATEAEYRIADHAATFSNQPLFLFMGFTAPHTPLQAPQELVNLVDYSIDTFQNLKSLCF